MKLVGIKLTQDVPVDPKHGMWAGRILLAIRHGRKVGGIRLWTVQGDADEEVTVISGEAVEIEAKNG